MIPTISLIIPSYNRCGLLSRALKSIAEQTLPPDETLVIDDGSTDNTASLLQENFPNVSYLYQENRGVSAARNRGIRYSKGEWLAFLDSDDEWLPEKLARQMAAFRHNPGIKICHSDEIWIRNGKRVNAMKKHAKKGGWIFEHCLPLCAMSPSSIVIHRSIFEKIGCFDESLPACEDYDLWLRISAQYPVLFIATPLIIKHGGHADQLSAKYWGMDRFRIRALEKIIAEATLDAKYRLAAIEMLLHKIGIYLQGARKRGKHDEIKQYRQLLTHYQSLRNDTMGMGKK